MTIAIGFAIQIMVSTLIPSTVKPNLVLVLTVFIALFTDEVKGWRSGFAGGLLMDIFSVRLFGLHALLLALGGYVIGKNNTKFYRDSLITHAILIFLSSLFVLSIYFISLNSRGTVSHAGSFHMILRPSLFLSSVLDVVLGIFLYPLIARNFKLRDNLI